MKGWIYEFRKLEPRNKEINAKKIIEVYATYAAAKRIVAFLSSLVLAHSAYNTYAYLMRVIKSKSLDIFCNGTIGRIPQKNKNFFSLSHFLMTGHWPEKKADILQPYHWFPFEIDARETSAEILYWWRVTIQIWVVLLIGRNAREYLL